MALPVYRPDRPDDLSSVSGNRGLFAVFAKHGTAANILMLLMIAAGIYAFFNLRTQFFPDFVQDRITVRVSWTDAPAGSVDDAIVQLLEPELRFLDDVESVFATAADGSATISLLFNVGTNMERAKSDVESAVDAVEASFPEDASDASVRVSAFRDPVSSILISGPLDEMGLKAIAERMRDDLLGLGLLEVLIQGARDPQIEVEVDEVALRRLGLTPADISNAIARRAQDLPAGSLGGDQTVRTQGTEATAASVADAQIRARADGSIIRVSDVAEVREIVPTTGRMIYYQGQPAISLDIRRGADGDSIRQQRVIEDYIAEVEPTLPANVTVKNYNVFADLILGRVLLLRDNAVFGVMIVLAFLFLFLNVRTALWIAVGIPVSIAATLGVMLALGLSINMLTLFALILSLGIIVDDAIVVGEYADFLHEQGYTPSQAAIIGAQRMVGPVSAAAATTVLAFGVLYFLPGRFGNFTQDIAVTVVAVLIASLIECFFVLPGHMYHALKARERGARQLRSGNGYPTPFHWAIAKFRKRFDAGFEYVRIRLFRPMVAFSVWARYPLLTGVAVIFAYSVAMVMTGEPRWSFFIRPENNTVNVNLTMVEGATRADTLEQMQMAEAYVPELVSKARDSGLSALKREQKAAEEGAWYSIPKRTYDRAALQIKIDLLEDRIANVPPEDDVKIMFSQVGARGGRSFGGTGTTNTDPDLLGNMRVELVEQDTRVYSTRNLFFGLSSIPKHPKLEGLASRRSFSGGDTGSLSIALVGGETEQLKSAALQLTAFLNGIGGVSEAEDDTPFGTTQLVARVSDRGAALGFDAGSVGQQLRSWLSGSTAVNLIRDDGEISVEVKVDEAAQTASFLAGLDLYSPAGTPVKLSQVVDFTEVAGFSLIQSRDGSRRITVQAELDEDQGNVGDVEARLRDVGALGLLESDYGVSVRFEGESEEQREFFVSFTQVLLIALALIYLVLAWVFQSFFRPVVVMAIIPLGFVGMVLGHLVHGQVLSFLSLIGFVGLTGIIVNDSIVLIGTIERRAKLQSIRSAIIDGAADRLRPVLLTSLTTIGGLTPLIFETSVQAQFLIPPSLTIVYGLGLGTVVVLILAPAMFAVQHDIVGVMRSSGIVVGGLLRRRRPRFARRPVAAAIADVSAETAAGTDRFDDPAQSPEAPPTPPSPSA
ncbi:MAG: hypothetical protein CME01_01620 [Geminicoccus sp.]|nr:hypothetical protein [Geminicoccus sp.]